ncbi:MAG: MotA/TolQ/ExbB proton channel family protein [Planctomycetes bacterium]|nr:MotA/TolQ/ExbB proton channel family protein [Planctomycetota bacterium]
MNLTTLLGLVFGIITILLTCLMGGAGLAGFWDLHALLIVFAGCGCAVVLAVNMEDLKRIPIMLRQCFGGVPDYHGIVEQLTQYSEIARKDGILALEGVIKNIDDEAFRKGLQLAVDGTSAEDIQKYFDVHADVSHETHEHGKKIMELAEKWAPSFGLLGTLEGLICMLQNLSDPDSIGPSMGVAMVATFYGAFLAFMLGGPLANKLQRAFDNEHHKYKIIRDGILAIQNGENSRLLKERLLTYVH